MSPPTQSPTPPNPILCLVQSGTAERNVAGEEAHPPTGLNLTFMAAHFKQTTWHGSDPPSELALLLWENVRLFPRNLQHCPDFTYFARKTETNHFDCLVFPPSSYLSVYTIFSVRPPVRKVNRNHPSLQGQAAHLSSLTKDFVLPLLPSTRQNAMSPPSAWPAQIRFLAH